MRKILVLLLLSFILSFGGCQNEPSDRIVTHGDLTITIPPHYQDISHYSSFKDSDFSYGFGELTIVGDHIPLAELDGWTPSLMEFAQNFVLANHLPNPPKKLDGMVTVYYEVEGDITWCWLAAFFQCSDGYWSIQSSCPAETYMELEQTLLNILSTVQTS
jgi:hypothetical protein